MKYRIEPLGDMIVCVKRDESDQTAGGFYLPNSKSLLNQGSLVAKVTGVGPEVSNVKVGDDVVFHNSPQWLKHELEEMDEKLGKKVKVEYTLISVKNVSGIIREVKDV